MSAQAPSRGTKHRLLAIVRVLVWLVVAACVVIFARSIRWATVRDAFAAADGKLLAISAALWICSTACQGTRWFALVRAVAKASWRSVLACYYVGQAGSVVLPMRAGEAVRIELLARRTGLSRAVALGTVAIDHTVNGCVMFLLAATLPFFLPVPAWTRAVVWAAVPLILCLVFVMLRLAKDPTAHPGASKLRRSLNRLRGGLVGLRRPRSVAGAFASAIAAWTLEIATTAAALAAFHLPHGVAAAMAILFGVNLALAIPAPPANLGNFELGAGFALVALGGDKDAAAAFALGFHALQIVPVLVIGGISLLAFRRRQIAAAAHVAAHPAEVEEAISPDDAERAVEEAAQAPVSPGPLPGAPD
ncbi:MAG: lysylphosphatidylglycerol synthase transmembrane domain-containing protein [Myxococcales bacterium]